MDNLKLSNMWMVLLPTVHSTISDQHLQVIHIILFIQGHSTIKVILGNQTPPVDHSLISQQTGQYSLQGNHCILYFKAKNIQCSGHNFSRNIVLFWLCNNVLEVSLGANRTTFDLLPFLQSALENPPLSTVDVHGLENRARGIIARLMLAARINSKYPSWYIRENHLLG